MTTNRIIGFVLLALGLLIIVYSLYTSFLIFNGEREPAELFLLKGSPVSGEFSPSSLEDIGGQVPQLLESLLPQDAAPRILNYFVWSMLAGFLVFGGTMIAGIGVRLLK